MAKPLTLFSRVFQFGILIIAAISLLALFLSYFSAYISPTTIWWFQLFGLAYPILVISSIAGLIALYFIRKKWMFAGIFILLVGIPVHIRYIGGNWWSANPSEQENTIAVASFNVRLFDIYKWVHPELDTSAALFRQQINNLDADIMCFQEYASDHRKTRHMDANEILKAGNFNNYAEELTVQTKNIDFGLAIYTKGKIVNKGLVNDEKKLYSLFADIALNGDTVRIYNTHLQSIRFQQDEYSLFDGKALSNKSFFERVGGVLSKIKQAYPERIKQTSELIEHAENSPHPVMICGDFNEPPSSYTYTIFNRTYQDAFRSKGSGTGRTYAGKIPAGRIDYIFADERLNILSFNILNDRQISDHFPIVARLQVK